jgi:hypothetical protein
MMYLKLYCKIVLRNVILLEFRTLVEIFVDVLVGQNFFLKIATSKQHNIPQQQYDIREPVLSTSNRVCF